MFTKSDPYWKWLVLLYFIVLSFVVYMLVGCVPIALYNYATHDVACEARQSDWERTHDTSEKFQEICNQRGTK